MITQKLSSGEYYRVQPILTDAGVITDFTSSDTRDLFNFKEK